ncbi:MAG TPA: type II secretion system minor pseudopilin GspJ [Gammaproteobacteria bacterium]|nr:type II secretion system minor pseudopilin GspJ [Gammaproteobacteria bacterium]
MSRGDETGLTLLEVLVAMAIFALVATAGYTALQQGIAVDDRLQGTRDFWRRLQSVVSLMDNDLGQARNRAPRAPAREWSLAFRGSESGGSGNKGQLFRLTRGGHTSFREGPVSPYQRVAYRYRDGTLYRATWARLDAPTATQGEESRLIGDLQSVRVRYLNRENRWIPSWPPEGASPEDPPGLPRAVEVTLAFKDRGSFRRLFHVGPPR